MFRWVAAVLALVVVSGALSACAPPRSSTAPDTPAVHQQFGVPAVAAPSGFTYQPDVHVVGGGRNAVLAGAGDGRSWTLDADAPGLDGVKVGDVLWATTYVVGRVADLRRTASQVQVTLLPVPLTDVIKDGHIRASTPIADSSMLAVRRSTPGWSFGPSTASATPAGSERTGLRIIPVDAPGATPWQKPAPGFNYGSDAGYKGYEISYTWAPDGLNVSVGRNFGGVKAAIDFGLRWKHPRFSADTSIVDGKVVSSSTSIAGLQSVSATLTGGAASPSSSIPRFKIEFPWSMTVPLSEAPPLVGQAKVSFILGAAFGGANATITAGGEWTLQGSIGGKTPIFAVKKSLIQSIAGISLAPSGIVAGISLRVLVGLGVPGVAIGPYTKLSVVAAVANGSALGAPLVRCRSATLDISGAVGAAFDVSSELEGWATSTKLHGQWKDRLKSAIGSWAEVSNSIVTRTQTIPDVPLCKSSSG